MIITRINNIAYVDHENGDLSFHCTVLPAVTAAAAAVSITTITHIAAVS